jgi:hypothetical protein
MLKFRREADYPQVLRAHERRTLLQRIHQAGQAERQAPRGSKERIECEKATTRLLAEGAKRGILRPALNHAYAETNMLQGRVTQLFDWIEALVAKAQDT